MKDFFFVHNFIISNANIFTFKLKMYFQTNSVWLSCKEWILIHKSQKRYLISSQLPFFPVYAKISPCPENIEVQGYSIMLIWVDTSGGSKMCDITFCGRLAPAQKATNQRDLTSRLKRFVYSSYTVDIYTQDFLSKD